jgi:hypothetical protein
MPYDESIAIEDNPATLWEQDEQSTFPQPTVPISPEPAANPREQYVAMAMQLQNMIRQRDQEQGGSNAAQQPSEDELNLKQQMAANNPFAQKAAQPRAMPAFQPPPTLVDESVQKVLIANQQAAMARRQADNALYNAMRLEKVKNVAEHQKVLAYTKQGYAMNRYVEEIEKGRNSGLDDEAARSRAAGIVLPSFFGQTGLSAIAGLMKQPPGTPEDFTTASGIRGVRVPGTTQFKFTPSNAAGMPDVEPSIEVLKDPTTGKDISILRTGPRTFSKLSDDEAQAYRKMLIADSNAKTKVIRTQIAGLQLSTQSAERNKDTIKKLETSLDTEEKYRKSLFTPPQTPPAPTPPPVAPPATPTTAPVSMPDDRGGATPTMPQVSNKTERDKLPPGTRYIGPDGKTYTRQ